MDSTTPRLFIKTGCPWCEEAIAVLDNYSIPYESIVVTGDSSAMETMVQLSGQTKAPTMDWDGDILADFGADELIPFLKGKGVIE
ncbi:MAG: glutaredoxin family protein [Verrucomicrobiota bacterium]